MATFVLDGRTMQDHYWGIGRYVFHLARALAEIAPQATFRVLCNPRAKNTRFDFTQLAAVRNIELHAAPANAFSFAEQRLAFQREVFADVKAVHAPYYALPYAISLPLIVTLYDLTPLRVPAEMPNPAARFIYRALNQFAARRARQIITISNASRADLVQHLGLPPQKISVIPLAAFHHFSPATAHEIERVRANLNLPPRYLLYLGNNKPHKNLLRLIQAFARVDTAARLVIAGEWDARFPQVKSFVAANNLEDRILFRHEIAEADLSALMSGAIAFAFPSTHEGFGLPALEAMACGAPLVCSNTSAMPEVVGDAALFFDPFDVQAIADALTRVLEDANLRATLKERGFEQAIKFSWERTARETLSVYESAIR